MGSCPDQPNQRSIVIVVRGAQKDRKRSHRVPERSKRKQNRSVVISLRIEKMTVFLQLSLPGFSDTPVSGSMRKKHVGKAFFLCSLGVAGVLHYCVFSTMLTNTNPIPIPIHCFLVVS